MSVECGRIYDETYDKESGLKPEFGPTRQHVDEYGRKKFGSEEIFCGGKKESNKNIGWGNSEEKRRPKIVIRIRQIVNL